MGDRVTEAQQKEAKRAMKRRQKAKDAYDKERDKIEHLRLEFVAADKEVRRLFKAMNTTEDRVFHD